ncbi:MAG: preprotein translocase subunit YajC [Acidimicrobiales bacterium]
MLLLLEAATKAKSSSSWILLVYVAVFAALYYFYIRPRSRRTKAARVEARQVEVGDRAQTVGGFVGEVIRRSDQLITLRSSSGAELDFIPSAIARRYDPVVSESADDHHADGEGSSGEATEGDK